MKKSIAGFIVIFFGLFISPIVAAESKESVCPDFPFFRPTTGPLGSLNCAFHHEYELRIQETIKTFGAPQGMPVILNLGGTLVLKYNGISKTIDITPDVFQEVKAFGHTFLALVLILNKQDSKPFTAHQKASLSSLQGHLQHAQLLIPSLKLSPKEKLTLTQLATLTEEFIQELLLKKQCSNKRLKAYVHQAKPLVFEMTVIASRIELKALDAAINPWLANMKPGDKEKIAIVVATSHQAAAEELSIQYFVNKFGARYQAGAVAEDQLVVLQNAFDEDNALKLLARHYLDRELSALIFNDPTYLQRDLFSAAGKKLL